MIFINIKDVIIFMIKNNSYSSFFLKKCIHMRCTLNNYISKVDWERTCADLYIIYFSELPLLTRDTSMLCLSGTVWTHSWRASIPPSPLRTPGRPWFGGTTCTTTMAVTGWTTGWVCPSVCCCCLHLYTRVGSINSTNWWLSYLPVYDK